MKLQEIFFSEEENYALTREVEIVRVDHFTLVATLRSATLYYFIVDKLKK